MKTKIKFFNPAPPSTLQSYFSRKRGRATRV